MKKEIEAHKCWECGTKAKWEIHYYCVSKGFHPTVYFCNNPRCKKSFKERNENNFTQTASYHVVN